MVSLGRRAKGCNFLNFRHGYGRIAYTATHGNCSRAEGEVHTLTSTCTVFVDETGWVDPRHRFFAIGALKVADPSGLKSDLRRLKAESGASDRRLRWADLRSATPRDMQVAKRALRLAATDLDGSFTCVAADTKKMDLAARYGDQWRAYNQLVSRAIGWSTQGDEITAGVLDQFTPPSGHVLERSVVARVNGDIGRTGLAAVSQSTGVLEPVLELADLMLGAVVFQLRVEHGELPDASRRAEVATWVMTELFGLTSYLGAAGGRLEMNGLKLETHPRARGARAGRRNTT